MPKAPSKQAAPGAKKAAAKISLAKLPPEAARKNVKALLLANPNYFGNLTDSEFEPVLNITGDTTYEDIGCVGFNPQPNRLEAVVYINQTAGYDGDVCSSGSQEFVRFYLSYDGGATWQDQGLTSFTVYDVPGPKPLEYDATLAISPSEDLCFVENLPQVRAILSWNTAPPANSPAWTPVWGNVVDAHIQIAGLDFIVLDKFLAESKAEVAAKYKNAVDLAQPVKAATPKALSALELHAQYKGKVPAHRFLSSELKKAIAAQGTGLAKFPVSASSFAGIKDINISDVIGELLGTDGDTTYEELDCVGLNSNLSQLVGIIKVKLSSGYSGGPCTAGSQEYVAFWVDWGSGWTYVGTSSVNVHDFSAIPPDGLDYSVFQPVDIASHRQPCGAGAKTAKVRAVLSWDTPPSTTDPYAPVTWGNSDETLILLNPGEPFVAGTPDISIIGGIGVAQIDTFGVTSSPGTTFPNAVFALTGTYADPWLGTRQCPFGGQIVINGQPTVGNKYRVKIQKLGSPTPIILSDPITITDSGGHSSTLFPDGSGFFTYQATSANQLNVLAYWYSSGDDQWYVWLEFADLSDTVLSTTPLYLIQLDNTPPLPPPNVPLTLDIHITSGTGDCTDATVGDTVSGYFIADDLHFGAWALSTEPNTLTTPSNQPAPVPFLANTDPAPAPSGQPWSLSTDSPVVMKPCGYVVRVDASDRSIVDSSPGLHNSNNIEAGFCLRAAD
jgi:DNA uptake protein ComE-like DNA-binding protein